MIQRTKLAAAVTIGMLALAGIALADTRSEIEARGNQWTERFGAQDAAGIAALYTEDAQMLPPQSGPVTGRTAIQQYWQDAMGEGGQSVKFEVLEVHGTGDLVAEVGGYVVRGAGGQELDRGKYIVLWKKSGGEWQLFRDIWNSSLVPEPAPAQ